MRIVCVLSAAKERLCVRTVHCTASDPETQPDAARVRAAISRERFSRKRIERILRGVFDRCLDHGVSLGIADGKRAGLRFAWRAGIIERRGVGSSRSKAVIEIAESVPCTAEVIWGLGAAVANRQKHGSFGRNGAGLFRGSQRSRYRHHALTGRRAIFAAWQWTKKRGSIHFPRFLPLSAVLARFIRHSRLRLRRCSRALARSSRQCASSHFHS